MGFNTPVPAGMQTPETAYHIIFAIVAVLLVVLLIGSAWEWRRTSKPIMTLMILGGFVCCFNEPLADIAGHCYFPVHGAWMFQTLFGRSVPMWVDLTYAIFFGAFPYFLHLGLKRFTRAQMWGAIISFWVANLILELPLTGANLYSYYGEQPLKIGGFPIFWLTINVLGAFTTAVVYTRAQAWFTGRRQLFLLVVPFVTYMASWTVDIPGFWALNSTASKGVKYAGVAIALALGVWAIDGLIRLGIWVPDSQKAGAPAPPAATTTASPEPPSRELQTA